VEGRAVEDAGLGAGDQHAPEAQLPHDLVQRALGDQELFDHVGETVEGRAHQGEEIALQLIPRVDAPRRGSLSDVIASEQDANATDADQNP